MEAPPTLYFLLCLIVLWMYRLWATIYMATYVGVGLSTYMCASYFVLTTVSMAYACGTSLRISETLALLNLWQSLETSFHERCNYEIRPFKRLLCCLKIAGMSLLAYMAAFNASFFSLAFDGLPVCVHTVADRLGLVPNIGIPSIVWRIFFYPLELLTLMPLMWLASLNGCVMIVSLEYFQMYLEYMR